jgi:nitroreductase
MKYNLSEITAVIKDRRTIFPELFSDRKIHREQVETILNNAIWAPTHGLTQPWSFRVFMGEGLNVLSEFLATTYTKLTPPESFNEHKFNKLKTRPLLAGAVIAVSLRRNPASKISELEETEAVACAIQNMYLTCTAWGLGAFWSTPGVIYKAEMNAFLETGEKDKCLALFYIGYPKEGIEWPKSHRRPIEYYTTWVEK